jgi:hypothetical protein
VTFAHLSAGKSIFLDANPLVYHFAPDPLFGPACNQLIARAGNGDICSNGSDRNGRGDQPAMRTAE